MIKHIDKEDVKVQWTGSYPTLCYGEWNIVVAGLPLNGLGEGHFETLGSYDSWAFAEDYDVEWSAYEDGLCKDDWIKEVLENNLNHLKSTLIKHNIEPNEQVLGILYECIQAKDWRRNSCGGCI